MALRFLKIIYQIQKKYRRKLSLLYCKNNIFLEESTDSELKTCFTRGCTYILIGKDVFFIEKKMIESYNISTNHDVLNISLFKEQYLKMFNLVDNKKFLIIEKRKIYK
jgi:hypothetical protein